VAKDEFEVSHRLDIQQDIQQEQPNNNNEEEEEDPLASLSLPTASDSKEDVEDSMKQDKENDKLPPW
jgi:hypothetical protein